MTVRLEPDTIRQVRALAEKYSLSLPERTRSSVTGETSGRRTGSSIEFQDRKDYTAGDDLRHIDWRSFARNDRLTVKLFREEVTPIVDLLVDCTASTAVTDSKRTRFAELAAFFEMLGEQARATVRVWAAADRVYRLRSAAELERITPSPVENPLLLFYGSGIRRHGGIRIFLSDFLFRADPRDVAALFHDADHAIAVQVLSAFEDAPTVGAIVRLEDAETNAHKDLRLDAQTVAQYTARVRNYRAELGRLLRAQNGALAKVTGEQSLEQAVRTFHTTGIVEA